MNFRSLYLLIMPLIVTAPTFAEEYKDPATFTRDEYKMVTTAKIDYRRCLQKEAIQMLQQSNDPKLVADTAMQSCSSILEILYTQITLANYSPDVARKFTWSISNREAQQLLSKLMQSMATRSVRTTPETTQTAPVVERP
ncbi:MAG: hypothetical protein O7D86_15535 [Proteobacteria bacterium]|nr:hypothetical protein [Pseudomonadota bacterium]